MNTLPPLEPKDRYKSNQLSGMIIEMIRIMWRPLEPK